MRSIDLCAGVLSMTVTEASKICTFIVKHLEKELHTIVTPSMTLSEVGIDSSSLFELQLVLETKYFPDAAISFPMLQLLENTVRAYARMKLYLMLDICTLSREVETYTELTGQSGRVH